MEKVLVDADGVIVNLGVKLRAPGQYDPDQASRDSGLSCPEEEGKTQQSFAEEVDINTIVKRYGLTGEMPMNMRVPLAGDFTEVTDFHSAMNMVIAAQEAFDQLPASMRARFHNDPGELISFLEDDANKEEAQKLGLVNKPPEPTRDMVQAIDELSAKLAPASGTSQGGAKP